MADAQLGHHLLRQYLDACKVNHLLRATDCYASDAGVLAADATLLDAFADLLAYPLPPGAKVQAGLPLSVGGCGLRCPQQVRPAARMAALCGFYAGGADRVGVPPFASQPKAAWIQSPLVDLQSCLGPNFDPLPRWAGRLGLVASCDAPHMQQHWWSEALGRRRLIMLLDSATPRDQARLLEQSGPCIGAAFMAITPSLSVHTTLSADTYRAGLRWWLGLPLLDVGPQSEPSLCPGCNAVVDQCGDHLLCCPRNNYTNRHSAVQEALSAMLVDAGQPFGRVFLIPDGAEQLRPADLLLKSWLAKLKPMKPTSAARFAICTLTSNASEDVALAGLARQSSWACCNATAR